MDVAVGWSGVLTCVDPGDAAAGWPGSALSRCGAAPGARRVVDSSTASSVDIELVGTGL
jgi:hypothetical protein